MWGPRCVRLGRPAGRPARCNRRRAVINELQAFARPGSRRRIGGAVGAGWRADVPQVPVVAEQLDGVLRALRPVAAGERGRWAIPIASPADSMRILRCNGKLLGHGCPRTGQGDSPDCKAMTFFRGVRGAPAGDRCLTLITRRCTKPGMRSPDGVHRARRAVRGSPGDNCRQPAADARATQSQNAHPGAASGALPDARQSATSRSAGSTQLASPS